MTRTSDHDEPPTPAWRGPLAGLMSAVLYTATNIALRGCVDVDAYLVSAVKAVPTAVCLAPVVGWITYRQGGVVQDRSVRWRLTPRRLGQFILASFLAQFVGNAAFQKALQHIGLAASVPITLGVLIVGGAALGALLLGEPVGTRKVVAMVILISSVVVLSLPRDVSGGATPPRQPSEAASAVDASRETSASTRPRPAPSASPSVQPRRGASEAASAWDIVIGSLWASLSGLAYGFFGVTMRQTLRCGIRATHLMLLSGLIGTLSLWSYCFAVLGWPTISATPTVRWATMATAGVLNFSAFIAITSSLRVLPVVAVNLINASQVAMAALAGVVLFGEPVTLQLTAGIALTFTGLVILARRTRAPIVIPD